MTLDALIESLLVWRAAPITLRELAQNLMVKEDEVEGGLVELEKKLTGRGLTLVRKDGAVAIGTRGEASELIKRLAKAELSKDLGRAGLETIAIVLYQGPVTRARIDYLRGVNSSFTLRHLLIRGLVERFNNPEDQRSFLYRPTFALLQYLGLKQVEDLPDHPQLKAEANERLAAGETIEPEL